MHSTVDPRAIYSLFSVWQFGGKKKQKIAVTSTNVSQFISPPINHSKSEKVSL